MCASMSTPPIQAIYVTKYVRGHMTTDRFLVVMGLRKLFALTTSCWVVRETRNPLVVTLKFHWDPHGSNKLPELITATLNNAQVSAGCASASLSSVPEVAFCSVPWWLGSKCIFDGSGQHPRQKRKSDSGSQTAEWHRASSQFSK